MCEAFLFAGARSRLRRGFVDYVVSVKIPKHHLIKEPSAGTDIYRFYGDIDLTVYRHYFIESTD